MVALVPTAAPSLAPDDRGGVGMDRIQAIQELAAMALALRERIDGDLVRLAALQGVLAVLEAQEEAPGVLVGGESVVGRNKAA